ncbi:EF-hand domain-containing protein D2-like [Clytia hemisphaerica]|uniref:EF-hand domain-containing protein n=1 Tax=Clytia hemisphaerica TaxID=252671 RepID=A0A7M5XAU7_9CNID
MAENELAKKLAHRNAVNEGEEGAVMRSTPKNVYTEFEEFTRKQIKDFENMFHKYDIDKSNFIDQHELQLMMEKLEAPQTFLGLKAMIKEVDEDLDGQISFREFLLIFRKAALGELQCEGLSQLAQLSEIDVDQTGVGGAKDFFEAKAKQVNASSKFEDEIRKEQEDRKKELEEARARKAAFKAKAQSFDNL